MLAENKYKQDFKRTFDAVGTEKGDVLGFDGVVVGALGGSGLGLGLSGEGRVVDLHARSVDDPEIGGDPVSALHFHDVSQHQGFGEDRRLGSVSDYKCLLRKKYKFKNN